jgi:hypothetical protein
MVNQKDLRAAQKAVQAVLDAIDPSDDSPRDAALRRRLEGGVLALQELTKTKPNEPRNP